MPHSYLSSLNQKYNIPMNVLETLWKEVIDNSTEKNKPDKNYGLIVNLFKKKLNRQFNLNESIMTNDRPAFDLFVSEKNILTMERDQIKNVEFGLSDVRKFPLNNKENVILSAALFENCDEERKPELAHRIMKTARELSISVLNEEIRKYA